MNRRKGKGATIVIDTDTVTTKNCTHDREQAYCVTISAVAGNRNAAMTFAVFQCGCAEFAGASIRNRGETRWVDLPGGAPVPPEFEDFVCDAYSMADVLGGLRLGLLAVEKHLAGGLQG